MAAPVALFPIITFIAKKGVDAAIKKYGKTAVKKAQEASKQPKPKSMRDKKGPSIANRERAATAAKKTRNRVAAGAAAAGAGAAGGYELMKRVGRAEMEKKGIEPSNTPLMKANGGIASAAKTITSKTTRSRNKTKPRGVGVALRGYGKALK